MDLKQWAIDSFYGDRYSTETTGIRIEAVQENYAKCSLVIEDKHMNKNDKVMGGAIFTLADFAFGVAANTPLSNCVSLSANINFLRATTGPVLYAEAKCVKNGRNVCFYDVTVTDSQGRIIATVVSNGFRSGPHAGPEPPKE